MKQLSIHISCNLRQKPMVVSAFSSSVTEYINYRITLLFVVQNCENKVITTSMSCRSFRSNLVNFVKRKLWVFAIPLICEILVPSSMMYYILINIYVCDELINSKMPIDWRTYLQPLAFRCPRHFSLTC